MQRSNRMSSDAVRQNLCRVLGGIGVRNGSSSLLKNSDQNAICATIERLVQSGFYEVASCGKIDLAAAMMTRPDVIVYPMAEQVAQMHALEAAISDW